MAVTETDPGKLRFRSSQGDLGLVTNSQPGLLHRSVVESEDGEKAILKAILSPNRAEKQDINKHIPHLYF